jgi:hypothetical protein
MVKVGATIKVLGYRGVSLPTEFAKVVAVRDIHEKPLKPRTYWYNRITRSETLVTVEYQPDADEEGPQYRSYYTEFLMYKTVKPSLKKKIFAALRSWWQS